MLFNTAESKDGVRDNTVLPRKLEDVKHLHCGNARIRKAESGGPLVDHLYKHRLFADCVMLKTQIPIQLTLRSFAFFTPSLHIVFAEVVLVLVISHCFICCLDGCSKAYLDGGWARRLNSAHPDGAPHPPRVQHSGSPRAGSPRAGSLRAGSPRVLCAGWGGVGVAGAALKCFFPDSKLLQTDIHNG